jgi:hypothetical protein
MNAELGGEEEVVFLRSLPIDHRQPLGERRTVRLTHRHLDTVAQQSVDLGVCAREMQRRPRPRDLLKRLVDRPGWHGRIQALDRRSKAPAEKGLGLVVAPQGAVRAERLVKSIDRLPPELLEQSDRRLLDQLILTELARSHAATPDKSMSRSVTSISPDIRRGRRRSRVEQRFRVIAARDIGNRRSA